MRRVRQSAALIPGNGNGTAPAVGWNFEMGFELYWSHFGIERIAFAFGGKRQARLNSVPGEVHRMAAHVADLAATEVPMHVPMKAAAFEVLRVIGMKRR